MTKILVIEDDRGIRTIVQKMLQAEGYDVVSAVDGRQGVELAIEHEPDLIICDIMMPEYDGHEVLQQLRQNPSTAMISFIFLSAKSEKNDLRQGMELGADDYLTKPFSRAELLGAISARLAKNTNITQPYITEMKRAAQSLGQIAYRDPLTNLPNRILLYSQLQSALSHAKKHEQSVAVVCINLDRFKSINATLGHAAGDLLLQTISTRLQSIVDTGDIVARIGGDEFCLVLVSRTDQAEIEAFTQTVFKELSDPYELNEQIIHIRFSMGIALYPQAANTLEKLLNQADMAMRQAKKQGCGFQFYTTEMNSLIVEREWLETNLKQALEREELQLLYQPQVNLITGRIIGAEALLRWNHPEQGVLAPPKFLPIAEENNLMAPIGDWILRTACTQAKAWQSANLMPIRIAVNLSPYQFKQSTLVEEVAQILSETGMSANSLVLELTEAGIMEDLEATTTTLNALQAIGVKISIDDFGTGYFSLSCLKRFEIDTLKIDHSFIKNILTDPQDAAIAKAIVAMAQSLQMKVIAEGVETEEQYNLLRQSGCHASQGYLFSPPLPAEEFEKLLQEDKRFQSKQLASPSR
jgi:diguanylate cyclase (GGDEF)-like protein